MTGRKQQTRQSVKTQYAEPKFVAEVLDRDQVLLQAAIIITEERVKAEIRQRRMYRERALKAAATRQANKIAARRKAEQLAQMYHERALKAAATRKKNKKKKGSRTRCSICRIDGCFAGPQEFY